LFVLQGSQHPEERHLAAWAVGLDGVDAAIEGLELQSVAIEQRVAQFDLTLVAADIRDRLALQIEYSSDLFDTATIQRLAGHWQTLLAGMVDDPRCRLSALPLLSPAENAQLLGDWAHPEEHGKKHSEEHGSAATTLVELFQAAVRRSPDALALVDDQRQLTYRQLAGEVHRLAHCLRQHGVDREVAVGVLLERSWESVVSLLAILQAGGVYVPLDPAYPAGRLRYLTADAGATVVLTTTDHADRVAAANGPEVLCLDAQWDALDGYPDRAPSSLTAPQNLAYLLYTSGSTGLPKGVAVAHGAAANHLLNAIRSLAVGPEDRALQFGSNSFDPALEQVLTALFSGARVILRGQDLWTPAEFLQRAADHGLTIVDLPTAYWQQVVHESLESDPPAHRLRRMIVGGEVLPPAAVRLWQRSPLHEVPLWNLYGPTEAVITATRHAVSESSAPALRIPIGRPLPARRVYIVDRRGRPVPQGVHGELWLGGPPLARGYLGRSGLSAERFVPDPFADSAGARLYRTGDRCRFLPDGRIDFLGRIDQQHKVRGFRVEIGEIETVAATHPTVREAAAVVVRLRGEAHGSIVAWVVPEDASIISQTASRASWVDGLRRALADQLPDYMLPAHILPRTRLPQTVTGKLDRHALADEVQGALSGLAGAGDPDHAGGSPRNLTEELLAATWAELLGVESLAIEGDFFALGGHSLLAIQAITRARKDFGVELPVRALFEAPTVAAFAERVASAQAESSARGALAPVTRDQPLPLSHAQERLWILDQLQPGNPFYNIPATVQLQGPLEPPALAAAIHGIVARHEVLRTTFVAGSSGAPMQRIKPAGSPELPLIDLSGIAPQQRSALLANLAGAEARRPFDLAHGPLLRLTLVRLSTAEHAALVTLHHIVADGWSLGIFLHELAELYRACATGRSPALAPLPVQYADFAVWQRDWLDEDRIEDQLAYWRQKLGGAPEVLELPTDHPRPPLPTYRGATRRFRLDAERTAALDAFGRHHGATRFMTLLGSFFGLLHRLSGSSDLVVGTPISHRDQDELSGLVGFFVNTLVVRQDLHRDPSSSELLAAVRDTALEAYAHPDVPFERLVQELQPIRDPATTPLSQVVFALEEASIETTAIETTAGELTLKPLRLDTGTAKFDLTLLMEPVADGLEGWLELNADLFDPTTGDRWLRHFDALLRGVVEHPETPVSALPLLSAAERDQLLREWSTNRTGYRRQALVPELFEAWAQQVPEKVAVVCSTDHVTYGALDRRASRLAHALRALGVGPEVLVAVCLERSLEAIVTMLAVLKSGGAYVPLDPSYPRERLAIMLADLQPTADAADKPLLLTTERHLAGLPEAAARVVCLDAESTPRENQPPEVTGRADQLAYVMYTSGSTGRPKGVAVNHRSIHRLVRETQYADFGPRETFLQFAPISFDAATFEIWGPLLGGGRLAVMPAAAPSLADLGRALRHQRVTTLWLTSGLFCQMVDDHLDELRSLRQLLAGGDVLSTFHVRRVLREIPGLRMINGYGPTENTTFSCCHPMSSLADVGHTVSIGKTIANSESFILDQRGAPTPVGIPGELLVGGDGLARGYFAQPGRTAERFVPHPHGEAAGERLYRTGDLARFLPDSTIDFLGRGDQQVKIRGFRIELEEIESHLSGHRDVEACAVVAPETSPASGDKRLVACLVAVPGTAPATRDLREFLQATLPDFMVPQRFTFFDALPLSAN
ncbi:MAG: amino acid adenylation domain-containing protein, partial [Acidobacteriota bacterium]